MFECCFGLVGCDATYRPECTVSCWTDVVVVWGESSGSVGEGKLSDFEWSCESVEDASYWTTVDVGAALVEALSVCETEVCCVASE